MGEEKKSNYEIHMNELITERLNKIESKGYVFGKRFSKRDYIITLVVVLLCLAILIVGAYL